VRKLTVPLAIAAAAVLALAGCTPAAETDAPRILRIEGPATMVENYNPFGPSEKGPGLTFIYDALVRVDHQHPEDPVKPWLAESWTFNDDATQLTLVLRDDVTFSDGTPLTSEDVKFTLSVPLEHPELNAWGAAYTSVEATDEHTIVLTFPDNSYGRLAGLANAPIVQAAQWEDEDVATFTNPEPIGSGLLVLDRIQPKSAVFDVRDDYWQGDSAVDRVEMVAFSPETFKLQLASGDLEWSGAAWPTAPQEFDAADPENHKSFVVPHGGAESLVLASNKAPFDDVHMRRAIALAIDVPALAELSGLPVPSPCGFTASRYADTVLIDECADGATRDVDVEAAQDELAAAGWSVDDGLLVKGDQSIRLTFAYPVSWTSAEPIYRDIKAQLQENLGIDVQLLTPPGDQYDAAVEEAHGALRFTSGAAGMLDVFRWMGSPGNFGGWEDARSVDLVERMSAVDPASDEYVELGKELQRVVYEDVPYIPTVGGNWSVLINSSRWSGWPEDPVNAEYLASPYIAPSATMVMLDLQPK
jgi:peptide/nickel transport system substrate-binding protein